MIGFSARYIYGQFAIISNKKTSGFGKFMTTVIERLGLKDTDYKTDRTTITGHVLEDFIIYDREKTKKIAFAIASCRAFSAAVNEKISDITSHVDKVLLDSQVSEKNIFVPSMLKFEESEEIKCLSLALTQRIEALEEKVMHLEANLYNK